MARSTAMAYNYDGLDITDLDTLLSSGLQPYSSHPQHPLLLLRAQWNPHPLHPHADPYSPNLSLPPPLPSPQTRPTYARSIWTISPASSTRISTATEWSLTALPRRCAPLNSFGVVGALGWWRAPMLVWGWCTLTGRKVRRLRWGGYAHARTMSELASEGRWRGVFTLDAACRRLRTTTRFGSARACT